MNAYIACGEKYVFALLVAEIRNGVRGVAHPPKIIAFLGYSGDGQKGVRVRCIFVYAVPFR